MSGTHSVGKGMKLRARPSKKQEAIAQMSQQVRESQMQTQQLLAALDGLYKGGVWNFLKWKSRIKKANKGAK